MGAAKFFGGKKWSPFAGKRTYAPIDRHTPYSGFVGDYLLDRYGCVHQWFEVDAPTLDVAGADRLVAAQAAIVNAFDAVPERIAQFQWIYSTSGKWDSEIGGHAGFSSTVFPILNDLRQERASLLLGESLAGTLTKNKTILVMSCMPVENELSAAAGSVVSGTKAGTVGLALRTLDRGEIEGAIASLELAKTVVEDVFTAVGIRLQKIPARGCAMFMYELYNPSRSRYIPFSFNEDETTFGDAWLNDDWELGTDFWKCGEDYHGLVSMNFKPEQSTPKLVERITTGSGITNLSVSLNMRRVDKSAQKDQLVAYRNKSIERMKENMSIYDIITGVKGNVDPAMRELNIEAKADIGDANRLILSLRNGAQFLVNAQLVCHTWAKSLKELDQNRRRLVARMSDLNSAKGVLETYGTYHVMRSCLPGSVEPMCRWLKLPSPMAADLTPIFKSLETSDTPRALFRNSANGLVAIDPFDKKNDAPMSFVSGATGSGKSFTVNNLLFQSLTEDTEIYIIDFGGSYSRIMQAFNGKTISFAANAARLTFNPLQIYAGNNTANPWDVPPHHRARVLSVMEILMAQPHDPDGVLPIQLSNKIDAGLEAVYALAAARNMPMVTLSDLHKKLSGDHDCGKELGLRLLPFIRGQAYGDFMDGPTNIDLKSTAVYLDLIGLDKDPKLAAAFLPVLINYIHDLVTADRSKRKILVFDEIWKQASSPKMAFFIAEAWKAFRKENAAVIGVSQNLGGDIMDNPLLAKAIIQSTESWFLLNQGKPADTRRTTEILGLSDGQEEVLKTLRAKKIKLPDGGYEVWKSCLFVRGLGKNNEISGEMRVAPTPLEYWLATTTPTDIAHYKLTLDSCGGDQRIALQSCAKEFPFGV